MLRRFVSEESRISPKCADSNGRIDKAEEVYYYKSRKCAIPETEGCM